jgi:AcrR family transcriptional regulator
VGAEERIRAAALDEFVTHGVTAFRVTSVATSAGCATSVLYHHFGSREGLLEAAVAQYFVSAAEAEDVRRAELVARARSATTLAELLGDLPSNGADERAAIARTYAGDSEEVASAAEAYDRAIEITGLEVASTLVARGLADGRTGGAILALLIRLLLVAPVTPTRAEIDAAAAALEPRGDHFDDAKAD